MLRAGCVDMFDHIDCDAAWKFCQTELWVPYEQGLGTSCEYPPLPTT